jgi:hypothetical protein
MKVSKFLVETSFRVGTDIINKCSGNTADLVQSIAFTFPSHQFGDSSDSLQSNTPISVHSAFVTLPTVLEGTSRPDEAKLSTPSEPESESPATLCLWPECLEDLDCSNAERTALGG